MGYQWLVDMKISDCTIVITGASRGIGLATARALAGAGGHLALMARSREIEDVAAQIVAKGGKARGYVVDVTDPMAVEQVARQVVVDMGPPDIIINNAGAGRWLAVEETPLDEVAKMMAAPYFAAFYVTRMFLPALLDRQRGFIVNVNSPVARLPWAGATGYMAARCALGGFTVGLRAELSGTKIQVLEIIPGKVSSTYFEHNPHSEERLPWITRIVPTLSPEDVAAALVRGIEHDRREVVIPIMLRMILIARALVPGLVDWTMRRTGWRRPL
jgi:short-subunit dehydrogenase